MGSWNRCAHGAAVLLGLAACVHSGRDASRPAPAARGAADVEASVDAGIDASPRAPPPRAGRLLAAGWRHTCAVIQEQLYCWGLSNAGQAGDGTYAHESGTLVAGLEGARIGALALGHTHSCAVMRDDGALWCWGSGAFGELGAEARDIGTPVKASLSRVVGAAAGDQHTCALLEDGGVRCFGLNDLGQLGDGSSENRRSPVAVIDLPRVTEVAAGARFSCARTENGRVFCWGANGSGQLGDGTTTSRAVPAPVVLPGRAREIAASAESACARLEDGTVACWGSSEVPEPVGTATRRRPEVVAAGTRFESFTVGDRVLCGRIVGGDVSCWGTNLDAMAVGPFEGRPAPVTALRGATELAAGGGHVCARVGAAVLCFGVNADGQVGDGSHTRRVPGAVPSLANDMLDAVTIGSSRTCVAGPGRRLVCFGGYEIAEDGTSVPMTTPRPPRGWTAGGRLARVAATDDTLCAIDDRGALRCMATPEARTLGRPAKGGRDVLLAPRDVRDVAVGADHVCFVDGGGDVRCLGDATLGALGPGARGAVDAPRPVPGLHGVRRIAAGGSRSCAITGGQVRCWGGGLAVSLDAVGVAQPALAPVSGLGSATSVAIGPSGGCAVTAEGLACWRDPPLAPLLRTGASTAASPATVAPIVAEKVRGTEGSVEVATSDSHTCALRGDGAVLCWGRDDEGQLGDGGTRARDTPFVVPLPPASHVAVGDTHSCALLRAGGMRCWGLAVNGALGDGTGTVVQQPRPIVTR